MFLQDIKNSIFDNNGNRTSPIELPEELIITLRERLKPYIDDVGEFQVQASEIPWAYTVLYHHLLDLGHSISEFDTNLWFSQAFFINTGNGPASDFYSKKHDIIIRLVHSKSISDDKGLLIKGFIIYRKFKG